MNLLLIALAALWIYSGLKKIPIGWAGVITIFGKRLHVTVKEGWKPVPWPLGVIPVDCRQVVVKLDTIEATTKDGIKVTVDGSIIRKIIDPYKFLDVDPKELRQGLDDIWDEIIRCQIREEDLEKVLSMHVLLGDKAKTHIHEHAGPEWGIDIVKVVVAGIAPKDPKVIEDLELRKREELQKSGQRTQAIHFGSLVNFFSSTAPLEPGGIPGPNLPRELAYEAALIHIDKATPKEISSKTFGLDPATVKAIIEAVMGGRR